MDSDQDQETLFHHHSYPCAYYVQSPSTISHANSSDLKTHLDFSTATTTFHHHSRTLSSDDVTAHLTLLPKTPHDAASRFTTLSRYSSSRGSNNSFSTTTHKKVCEEDGGDIVVKNRLIIVDGHGGYLEEEEDEDEDEEEEEDGGGGWWWRYCSWRRSSCWWWVCLQVSWRMVVSLGIALLVFYIATKPPSPNISVKVGGIREFGLGEGVDGRGVTTKILTLNTSLDLLIDNKSKLFGLHIHPPLLHLSFSHLPFALSMGSKMYAESHRETRFKLYVGTRNKPMYGAGRNMEDMLESGTGLPLTIRLSFTSSFRVVWDLIKPKFHHHAQCFLLLYASYDKKHRTQTYNSTCIVS